MFEVGDEVVCVDDGDEEAHKADGAIEYYRCGLVRGQVYTVIGVYPKGSMVQYGAETISFHNDFIAVGVPDYVGHDSWWSGRFRKVERKRTREELYALIGISVDAKGGARVSEPVPELV